MELDNMRSVMESSIFYHEKLQKRVKREISFHIFGVIVFIIISITVAYDLFKQNKLTDQRIIAIAACLFYFIVIATAIQYFKSYALKKLSPGKLRTWVKLELFNMTVLTLYLGYGTTKILKPPFDKWTGTFLLMVVYWFPLMAYKTSQICRIGSFLAILDNSHVSSNQINTPA